MIAGAGRARIRDLQARSGAQLRTGEVAGVEFVEVCGTSQAIAVAKALIAWMLEVVPDTLPAAQALHGDFGAGRERLDSVKNPDGRPVSDLNV
eukprot:CAMPEP_0195149436 /NCGR_PEP_ID=MMETSP0448-20130528/177066_1 /TAXON_ID=66468 /ORGANISM="Heterocapsa triquestra, Strain CCMP 448" /LENGTH=92 /DNA_ID=CAMNT_0040188087 /DNA_START=17 /DNA_END=291 /DNA_ORIENTATION=-